MNSLLCQSQSGFRPQHSCHTALAKLCDNWLSDINNSGVVGAVFLDLKKLLIFLIIIFYLRNYPYIQQTPHLSRYLELRSQSVYVNGDTLMKALFVVEFLKDLF